MRAVLALLEGVATGAADGYARMSGRPAATLLHLGPGLGNGLANLHNARRAKVPVVNIVGDHATYHTRYDAPLPSDIETVARNVSGWVRTTSSTDAVAEDAAEAIAAAMGPPGQVATLILPADVSWSDGATRPCRASTGHAIPGIGRRDRGGRGGAPGLALSQRQQERIRAAAALAVGISDLVHTPVLDGKGALTDAIKAAYQRGQTLTGQASS